MFRQAEFKMISQNVFRLLRIREELLKSMLKKVLMLLGISILFFLVAGCSVNGDFGTLDASEFVGMWSWDLDDTYIYVFEEDGTGIRGFPNTKEPFEWEFVDNELRMTFPHMTERWQPIIDNDVLTITSLQELDMQFSYIRLTEGDELQLIGRWAWSSDMNFIHVFEEDGNGYLIFSNSEESFEWEFIDNELHMTFPYMTERWRVNFGEELLVLSNLEADDEIYIYTRWLGGVTNVVHASEFVGMWSWDLDGTYIYVFEGDGTGTRGFSTETESFEWDFIDDELRMTFPHMTERWQPIIDNDVLTITSLQVRSMQFSYIRGGVGDEPVDSKVMQEEAILFARESIVGIQHIDGQGSGFVYGVRDGNTYIVTNEHVVRHGSDIEVVFNNKKQTRLNAVLVGVDTYTDLAILRVDNYIAASVVMMGDSANLRIGETVIAMASPFIFGFEDYVAVGSVLQRETVIRLPIISNNRPQYWEMTFLQTDTEIIPGYSGGPLINLAGEVVGINTAGTFLREEIFPDFDWQRTSYSISINMALPIIRDLIEHGEVINRY